ncbi:hypothetical protein RIF29_36158 [Crotalaria pallida]|uniref:Cytochrome P450 n=1 Tax=Crotalaria pallida TaxID=3830 RepID=A0AAN9HYD7_CROPI
MDLLPSFLKQLPNAPNSSTLYLLFVICFIISILFVIKLTRLSSKSNLPPSPPKLPIIGNLHQLGTLPHRSLRALSQKYGPLMLLHLGQAPTLVVSSADIVQEIAKTHDVAFSNRFETTAAKIFFYGCKDLSFVPYGEEWRQKRKVCVLGLLSMKMVKSFFSIRQQEVGDLVNTIREACISKKSYVNLSEMLMETSINISSRCVLGKKYDAQDGVVDGVLVRKIMRQFATFGVGDFFPSLGWVDVLTGLISEFKATFAVLDAFLDEVIAEHDERRNGNHDDEKSNDEDFVDKLLQLQDSGRMLERDSIKAILMDMFIGGSDTTSITSEWAIAELVKNPNTMKKAQEEARRVVRNKLTLDENDVNQMNYLKCVIKETLRLHPPLPLLPKQTISSVKLKGYDIPPKTKVILNAWAIQRDLELWENSEEFIPERFESSQVNLKGQDFQLIPFGIGRRGCPGISFGLASIEYKLANLLYWFDWKLPRTNNGLMQDIDMNEMKGLSIAKKKPLYLEPILHSFD